MWSFYVDLEESIGSVESTKAVYDKIIDLKIANAQTIVNYAHFLEDNKYLEERFKVRCDVVKRCWAELLLLTYASLTDLRAWY